MDMTLEEVLNDRPVATLTRAMCPLDGATAAILCSGRPCSVYRRASGEDLPVLTGGAIPEEATWTSSGNAEQEGIRGGVGPEDIDMAGCTTHHSANCCSARNWVSGRGGRLAESGATKLGQAPVNTSEGWNAVDIPSGPLVSPNWSSW